MMFRVCQNQRRGITWLELTGLILFVVLFLYVAVLQYFVIEANIAEISCNAVTSSLGTAVQAWRTEHPERSPGNQHKAVDVDALLKEKMLNFYPECWYRGVYRLNGHDAVYCTYHNPEMGD